VAATTVQALNQNKESLLLQHKSPNPYASLKSPSLTTLHHPQARDLSIHFADFGPY
jgi:hypothetical protein